MRLPQTWNAGEISRFSFMCTYFLFICRYISNECSVQFIFRHWFSTTPQVVVADEWFPSPTTPLLCSCWHFSLVNGTPLLRPLNHLSVMVHLNTGHILSVKISATPRLPALGYKTWCLILHSWSCADTTPAQSALFLWRPFPWQDPVCLHSGQSAIFTHKTTKRDNKLDELKTNSAGFLTDTLCQQLPGDPALLVRVR